MIQPTTMFASPKPMRSTISVRDGKISPNCNTAMTPQCLKDLYGTSGYVPSTMVNNSVGITGYLEQYVNLTDLHQFLETYVRKLANFTFSLSFG